MLDYLIQLDRVVTLAINSLHTPFTDGIWRFFSWKQVWFVMYAIVAGVLFWRLGWKKALVFVVSVALTIVCCDQLSDLCKEACARLRPCFDQYMIDHGLHIIYSGGKYGFFSGHAANSFGFAVGSSIALRTDKRLKYRGYLVWIYAWAVLVSISRVFISMHFFGDILVGGIVGSAIALAFGYLARYCIRKFNL